MGGVLVAQQVVLISPDFKLTNMKIYFGKFFQAEEHNAPDWAHHSASRQKHYRFGHRSRDRSFEAAGVKAWLEAAGVKACHAFMQAVE